MQHNRSNIFMSSIITVLSFTLRALILATLLGNNFLGAGEKSSAKQQLQPLSLLSNCSHSFGLSPLVGAYSKTPVSFLNLSSRSIPSEAQVTLVAVNVGFGTTGTHAIHKADTTRYGKGCHYRQCSVPNWALLADTLSRCVGTKGTTAECRTANWTSELRSTMIEFSTAGPRHVSDFPASFMLGEFRNLLPDILVQHSLRSPLKWVLRRIGAAHNDIMCKNLVQNPFHILECMQGSEFLHESLQKITKYARINLSMAKTYVDADTPQKLRDWRQKYWWVERPLRELAAAYITYNRWVVQNVRADRYQPICLWDSKPHLHRAL